MKQNDRIIKKRMDKLHDERKEMEQKILNAVITIQRMTRGMIQRKLYKQ